jgi:hypothetical protein
MAYWLDDNWSDGPMIHEIGLAAWGLYTACGLWVARHLTDGFVPEHVIRTYAPRGRAALRALLHAGLLERDASGYYMPDYLKMNPSAEKVRYQRKLAAERAARYRKGSCP